MHILSICLGQLSGLSKNYHSVITQLNNGLQPSRNLKSKFLINSKLIKTATEHYAAGLISIWQFLNKCSYACSSYEQRQRQWALGVDEVNDVDDNLIGEGQEVLPLQPIIEDPQVDVGNNNQSTCMTCLSQIEENTVQFIVLPCGHAWVCAVCIAVLNDQFPRRCPMCRSGVDTFQQIFYG